MATPTTTIATTTTTFVLYAAERDEVRTEMKPEGNVQVGGVVGAAQAAKTRPNKPVSDPFGFAALHRAYRACRRGKRGTRNAQRYEMSLLDNLVDTAQALQQQTWRPSRPIRFVTLHPKPREILAAEFGDRVVHHLLVPWFERLFEPVFIHDSHANRLGKGTHAAVDRLQHFLRAAHAREVVAEGAALAAKAGSGSGEVGIVGKLAPTLRMPAVNPRGLHYLQLDIANFFNSIDRRILFGLLKARVERDRRRPVSDPRHVLADESARMLWLARLLLTGNPAMNARFQGRGVDLARVPAHKQLINAPAEKGLPIGNLTSQFFANVYLNELDQFVKHTLKARWYVRYVDDLVLLHSDPAQLAQWRERIEGFLHERLGLSLRDAGRLAPVANGIDFLGYVTRPHYRLVRRRVLGHMRDRLAKHRQRVIRPGGALELAPGRVEAIQATLASYFGHFKHAKANRLRADVFAREPWLGVLFDGGGREVIAPSGAPTGIRRVDRPVWVTSLASQWRYFQRRFPGHVTLIRVGNRLEAYGDDAERIAVATHCLGAPVQRTGLAAGRAWPIAYGARLRARLARHGVAYCQIDEAGWLKGGMKRRELRWLYPVVPAGAAGAAIARPPAATRSIAGIPPGAHEPAPIKPAITHSTSLHHSTSGVSP